jgi:hypothetical protein
MRAPPSGYLKACIPQRVPPCEHTHMSTNREYLRRDPPASTSGDHLPSGELLPPRYGFAFHLGVAIPSRYQYPMVASSNWDSPGSATRLATGIRPALHLSHYFCDNPSTWVLIPHITALGRKFLQSRKSVKPGGISQPPFQNSR